VADEIVVINDGRIEQVGSPDELYDQPANEFVMSFLGPVTRLSGDLIRPHDIDVFAAGGVPASVPGEVTRVVRVGFETRLTVRPDSAPAADGPATDDAAIEAEVTVVLTRAHARELDLDEGSRVWLAPNRGATMHRSDPLEGTPRKEPVDVG
jgi:sulfate transport system ATP-binding protein